MKRIIPEPFLSYSRKQRKSQNPWEAKLWQHLRAGRFYGLKFKRQVLIGPYIYDFSCRSKMVVVELDGGQHTKKVVAKRDVAKQELVERAGYKVLRFWNDDVDNNIEGILETIRKGCNV